MSLPAPPRCFSGRSNAALAILLLCASASAQVRFSITRQSVSVGTPDSALGTTIDGADVLAPPGGSPAAGPLAAPEVALASGQPSSGQAGLGIAGALRDVDALSFGRDARLQTPAALQSCGLYFSIAASAGFPAPLPALSPSLWSETPAGLEEVAGDLFVARSIFALPAPPGDAGSLGSGALQVGWLDGNGLASASGTSYPGLGLVEPSTGPGVGDDVDAFDTLHDVASSSSFVFFSLTSQTAFANGFEPDDVLALQLPANGSASIYAYARYLDLGLQLDGTSDVDGLAVWDDGDGLYQPGPLFGYGNDHDMLLFSVRADSGIVGAVDSLLGWPIEPGDILIPPPVFGARPGILVAAEQLGLRTQRMGFAVADDLDALDVADEPLFDCDANGREDACDIADGALWDTDHDGSPDFCDPVASYCPSVPHSGGCASSMTISGTPSLTGADDFVLGAEDVLNSATGLLFWGVAPAAIPYAGGTLCIAPPVQRTALQYSFGSGTGPNCTGSYAYPFAQATLASPYLGAGGAGADGFAQYWFRDSASPFGVALTDAIKFTVAP